MLPLPKSFQGQTAEDIVTRLLADAYTPVVSADPQTRIFRDAKESHLIRLSTAPSLADAFCKACQANKGNSFLPDVFSHATLGPDLHVSVTENLISSCETGHAEITMFGHARAVSSLFEGDEMHAPVHKFMAQDETLLNAVRTIFNCGLALCQDPAAPAVMIDPRGQSILFRANEKGCQTVYANPLIASDQSKAESLKKMQWIIARFSDCERHAPHSPYWR